MEAFGEKCDRTSVIKSVLDGYPASNAILRELLQNSDDAGSTTQTFILDERTYNAESLLVPELRCSQGPALLAVNDSVFRPQDWEAIRTIHSSSKKDDATAAGKFGLGFRSSYHVTDFPQILSGTTLVVFDPHELAVPEGGLRVSDFLPVDPLHLDQLSPFKSAVPLDAVHYPGTVIRLPLRTDISPQRISSFIPTAKWMMQLFNNFISDELDEEMLFLKNIESIRLVHIDQDGQPTQYASSRVIFDRPNDRELRKFRAQYGPESATFRVRIETSRGETPPQVQAWRITHWNAPESEVRSVLRRDVGRDASGELAKDKLFPHAACAFPLNRPAGIATNGRLFTLLPLPIYTQFPVHCHAIFALTSTRQALKNSQERGLGGRDQLLVAWNRLMFGTVIASAWARLLDALVRLDSHSDIYALWPHPDSRRDPYWEAMGQSILRVVLEESLQVWPVHGHSSRHVALSSCLVAPPETAGSILNILACLDIDVVVPPPHIHSALPKSSFDPLSARAVHRLVLQAGDKILDQLSSDERISLAEFLASSARVDNVSGLSLAPLHDGKFAALRPCSTFAEKLVLCERQDRDVFGGCSRTLVAMDLMGPCLRKVVTQAQVQKLHNVTPLTPSLAHAFVLEALPNASPDGPEEVPSQPVQLAWVLKFWAWASTWPESRTLFSLLSRYHVLPTHRATFRRLCDGIVTCTAKFLNGVTGVAFQRLGVPFLHTDAAQSVPLMQSLASARSLEDMAFIVRKIDNSRFALLSEKETSSIKRHFLAILNKSYSALPDQAAREDFAALPIFDTASTKVLKSGAARRVCYLGPAAGSVIFVGSDVHIVPRIPGTTFLDMSDRAFGAALCTSDCFDEKQVLELCVPHLAQHPHELLDHLLHRMFCRWIDLSPGARADLTWCAVLPVNAAGTTRIPLAHGVNPNSAVAVLFSEREEVFPSGRFRRDSDWGLRLASCGILQRALSEKMVHERMRHFASARADSSAVKLLELADAHYQSYPTTRWQFALDVAFLPHPERINERCALQDCRDSEERYLFDLVVPVIGRVRVKSSQLRAALGWATVPIHIVVSQLKRIVADTVDERSTHSERLMRIIRYLAAALPTSTELMLGLKNDLDGVEWIPIDDTTLCPTRHANREIDIGPFRRVPLSLRGPTIFDFLTFMGCSVRPGLSALIAELRALQGASGAISVAVQLLKEIVDHHQPIDPAARADIPIPDTRGVLRGIDTVYFNNAHGDIFDNTTITHANVCHPSVSQVLAEALDVPKLTDLLATSAELDDDDEEDFGEDLYDRIRGVLRDYDRTFAMNEFVANANDASATTFTVLLDEGAWPVNSALSPELAECQSTPALLLHNDSRFTADDFRRMRRFGRTKDAVQEHAVGQFGLGALNFWHFCDVAMIVSGEYVMFIDPSKSHIPQRNRAMKRASLRFQISAIRSSDHLARLYGLFGFTDSMDYYDGTIILLPLRSPAHARNSLLSQWAPSSVDVHALIKSYFDMARLSLFCTTLRAITCQRRTADRITPDMWGVFARDPTLDTSRFNLQVHHPDTHRSSVETWYLQRSIVEKNSLPAELQPLLRKDRFTLTLITGRVRSSRSRIMASVPMPVTTALPIHISAPFVVASDRRSLRYEPPDARGHCTPGSAFNTYILDSLVPDVYFELLEQLSLALPPSTDLWDWWPRASDDKATQTVTAAFYSRLPSSAHKILRSASGQFVSARNSVICLDKSDPSSINGFLYRLQPDDLSCPPSSLQKNNAFSGLPIISPSYVRFVLMRREQLLEQQLTAQRPSLHPAIEALLTYLLDNNTSVDALRLLPLSSGDIGMFGEPQVFYALTSTVIPPTCLSLSRFVDTRISISMRKRLVDVATNVQPFDAKAILDLLARDLRLVPQDSCVVQPRLQECIRTFWEDYAARRIPASFDELGDLPLLRADAPLRYVSLRLCRAGGALLRPAYPDTDMRTLLEDLTAMGMQFLHPDVRTTIPLDDRPNLEFTLLNVVSALRKLGSVVDIIHRVRNPSYFAAWIRSNLPVSAPPELGLSQLPIWPACTKTSQDMLAALDDLRMLPPSWSSGDSVRAVSLFLSPGIFCAPYDTLLARFLPASRHWSTAQAFQSLTFPSNVERSHLPFLLHVLRLVSFSDVSSRSGGIIPDASRTLRAPSTMFDHRVPVFAAAFQSVAGSRFVHPEFRSMIDHLVGLGVHSAINFSTFLEAAHAVDSDFWDGTLDVARAEQIFECFLEDLPSTLRRPDFQRWNELRGLHFVPRTTGQVEGLTFVSGPYIRNLNTIVAPSDIVQPGYEAIAWTQCARLSSRHRPSQQLLIAFSEFGQPSMDDVVAHLVALATKVVIDHAGNATLLNCLRDTYAWLDRRADEAGRHLLRHKDTALFLNIDSTADAWRFQPASALVVGLTWDEEDLFGVREWLLPYKALLLAAGASPIAQVEFKQSARNSRARPRISAEKYNDMRLEDKFCDFQFISHSGTVFRAHKLILAVASDHLGEHFSGTWSTSPSETLDETDFCIESVLSFLYTGSIERPTLKTNEEAGIVLRELLDLLKLADMWQVEGLKDEVAAIVAGELKLVGPTTVHEIAEHARTYNVEALVDHCAEYIDKNRNTLRLLGCAS
ncbi:hypothetical protein EXIGLDRAFT_762968 [Exidia glandulosa HHB12029]|uniref:BTB domain-containing protein n=1 Tax=Exidia glandulosa HHB12029 TaxID=1314781 RepID=A0A165M9P2_EXIGL|nr:hypothetical protein EXIGLDRAFT_762968 [Exidia glandulosa HHB12029]